MLPEICELFGRFGRRRMKILNVMKKVLWRERSRTVAGYNALTVKKNALYLHICLIYKGIIAGVNS